MIKYEDVLAQIREELLSELSVRENCPKEQIVLLDPSCALVAQTKVMVQLLNEHIVTRIKWEEILPEMRLGDFFYVAGKSVENAGSNCARYSKDGKKFIAQVKPKGLCVTRVL
jgi:hypothetical protein